MVSNDYHRECWWNKIWIVYFVYFTYFLRGISCGGTYLVLEVNFILVSFSLTHACWYFDAIEQVGQNVLIWSCWWYTNRKELEHKCNTILASWFVSQKSQAFGRGYKFLGLFMEAFGVSCKREKQSLSLLQFMVF